MKGVYGNHIFLLCFYFRMKYLDSCVLKIWSGLMYRNSRVFILQLRRFRLSFAQRRSDLGSGIYNKFPVLVMLGRNVKLNSQGNFARGEEWLVFPIHAVVYIKIS